jgi:hypothetical protein
MALSIKLLTRGQIYTAAEVDDQSVCISSEGVENAQDLADLRDALDLDDPATGYMALGGGTMVGKLVATAGIQKSYVAKTATYAISSATDYCINCTANAFTVTLPTAVSIAGQEFVIKNSGAGVITIATTSSQTIDGATTATLTTQYESITLLSNGANWIII